jgi:hypothetical protein
MEGWMEGEIDSLIDALQKAEREELLREAGLSGAEKK